MQGKCVAKMSGHNKSVFSCSFSPDRMVLASASHDCSIRLWDLAIAERERDQTPLSPRSPMIKSRVSEKEKQAAAEDNARALRDSVSKRDAPPARMRPTNGAAVIPHSDAYIKTLNGHTDYV